MDLLPCPNLDTDAVLELMAKHPHEREHYSKALTKLQVEHVKGKTETEDRDVIRLLKFWRDATWKRGAPGAAHGGPSSYLLELLVVHAKTTLVAPDGNPVYTKHELVAETLALMRAARCGKTNGAANLRVLSGHADKDLDRENQAHTSHDPVVVDAANPCV